MLVSTPGNAKTLASRPYDAKALALMPNESLNHVSLVFCFAPEVSVLSNKSTPGINNIFLLTRLIGGSILIANWTALMQK